MKNITGNLWDGYGAFDCLCITTNGTVKNNGSAVMGRGCAKEAVELYPGIQRNLGKRITKYGNNVQKLVHSDTTEIWSFPVKHEWYEQADIDLIRRSCKQLTKIADEKGWKLILIPRPGCGNGKLKYKDVEPILQEELDNRFYIVTFKRK